MIRNLQHAVTAAALTIVGGMVVLGAIGALPPPTEEFQAFRAACTDCGPGVGPVMLVATTLAAGVSVLYYGLVSVLDRLAARYWNRSVDYFRRQS